jgi:hypothetical protein
LSRYLDEDNDKMQLSVERDWDIALYYWKQHKADVFVNKVELMLQLK